MREIGSEFWEIEVQQKENRLFPKETKWFISGRSALEFIVADMLRKKPVGKAWLPSWCCESMVVPFVKRGIEVAFYPVYFKQGKLVCELPSAGEAILVMDYFGYQCMIDVQGFPGVVIRDLTHSVHACTYQDADYAFGSLRKWTGICTGGYALSKEPWAMDIDVAPANHIYVDLKNAAMKAKSDYIKEITDDKVHLEIYSKAEEILEHAGIESALEEDVEKAKTLNISYMKDKRRENARFLMQELGEVLMFDSLSENDCPLFVPILVDNRDALRHFLIENKVYCPVHWPVSKYHRLTCQTAGIYERELSIICDQRYDLSHMEHIVKLIKKGMDLC